MITESRWQRAQSVEANYWAGVSSDVAAVLYELTEHAFDILPGLTNCLSGQGLKGIEFGVGGLGIGFLAVYKNQHFSQVVGIEPSPNHEISLDDKFLERYAKGLQSRVEVVKAKGEQAPFKDGMFDVACCINVLDHTHLPDDVLKEMHRVLKKGGLLILAVHTRSPIVRFKWWLMQKVTPQAGQYEAHPHTFSWSVINKKLLNYGYSLIYRRVPSHLRRLFGFAHFSVWIVRKGVVSCGLGVFKEGGQM